MKWTRVAAIGAAAIGVVAARDLTQKQQTLKRNFPVIAHARYLLERIGPELRQYIVTSNDEERPFSRDQRRWVYASAKQENTYFGFGTDNDIEHLPGYVAIKHRAFPGPGTPVHAHEPDGFMPGTKVVGRPRDRAKAFRPESIINISAMSFGSMSHAAIEALNRGAALAGCMHNTGEGGLSPYHRQGGDLVLQIGTAYFGCRDERGRFDLGRLCDVVASAPVKMIEIKVSQGAKPGLGGLLPAAKVTEEIAEIRGIPVGVDCESPSRHSAFTDVDSMLDFVESIAQATGLPVGIKSAVGEMGFWQDLAQLMVDGQRGVDFVTVDGGEGGTGAAPLVFADSIALPFRLGLSRVYREFASVGIEDEVAFIGSAKLGLPDNAAVAFALGADMINVAREAMLALGCIQSQKCHTDDCPTGVATQRPWLVHGLDPVNKAERVANYIRAMRAELVKICEAVGVAHPGLLGPQDIDILCGDYEARSVAATYGYQPEWGVVGPKLREELIQLNLDR